MPQRPCRCSTSTISTALKHSSSDGQRVETQIHTINARHGSKYFGLKKGVSAYTLVANHVPMQRTNHWHPRA